MINVKLKTQLVSRAHFDKAAEPSVMNSNYQHVLILEDDAVTAEHLSSILVKQGITSVTRFESGFEVLHEVEHSTLT